MADIGSHPRIGRDAVRGEGHTRSIQRETGDVEHGKCRQGRILSAYVEPCQDLTPIIHVVSLGQHGAFGKSRCAARVHHEDHVVHGAQAHLRHDLAEFFGDPDDVRLIWERRGVRLRSAWTWVRRWRR